MTISNLLMGQHVRLTSVMPDDVPDIANWYADARFMRLYDAEPAMPRTTAQMRDYITDQQKSATAFPFAIRLQDRGDLIGYVEVDGILWNQGTGWLSIAIGDPAQRSRGYGTEALRLALGFAFSELNLRRVQLTVFAYNAPAIALYEKLGFMREGAFREFMHRDGQVTDMLLYGLLRREWEAEPHD